MFTEHAAARYTSTAVLDAEERLVTASHTITDGAVTPGLVAAALADFHAPLDDGQRALVTAFATDPRCLVVGIGAAGTGKTTATRAYLHVLHTAGRRLVPLATSAASAAVLANELGVPTENVHKFLHEHTYGPHAAPLAAGAPVPASHAVFALQPGDVVLVDEAGMAGTGNLDRLVTLATAHGATVRLLGDYRQLAAVESGGALRLIAADAGTVELDTLHRFADSAEASATLGLRTGDTTALDFYTNRDRISGGSREAMNEAAYTAWHTDMTAGRVSLMIAATNRDVTALPARARADRVTAGHVEPDGIPLADGNQAGLGDWIVTRRNQRRLSTHGGRDFVRNGDAWTVTRRHDDGSLTVRHHDHRGVLRLPASYIAEYVQLLYATTAHRAQGSTVDTAHVLADDSMAREHLYVAATRARHRTHLYVTTHELLPLDDDDRVDRAATDPDTRAAREVLDTILGKENAELSATETIRRNQDTVESLAVLAPRLAYAERAGEDGGHVSSYMAQLRQQIAGRIAFLVDDALRSRPAWTAALGEAPMASADRRQWRNQLAVVAAYRDQHRVLDDDPAYPLGPYARSEQPHHRAYWEAAQALVRARQLAERRQSLRPRDLTDAEATHQLAVHVYNALPGQQRLEIATSMVARLGNLWHGHPNALDEGVTQPAYAAHLRRTLADEGHLERPSRQDRTARGQVRRQHAHEPERRPAVRRQSTERETHRTPTPLVEPPRHQPRPGPGPRPQL